ncbi:glycosyltransferase involved in cell wall biosynthesis [Myroides gitamensis]|uniref:glycosyltransferase n=1 Tax=Myroides odoratus TaxID=256 RepID=UPI002168348C|nr:glycosyltransferase [Myroides odoratus]MCS4239014.1 glycosyltransferase involved in cell wall biosynthesis [Myroides odoratus]MDH6599727.1 glycosyltransferase involved in cell wall biosynthesis [Myroides gitamensis]
MYYSFIIPVYNRPDETDELLASLTKQTFQGNFEVVIVEDGSAVDSRAIVEKYQDQLDISYYYKSNSGPGDSRNYGMRKAKGDYYIILDSDCIIPEEYLRVVDQYLQEKYVDCFGGPDRALSSFTEVQKAINFAMTSFLTTGGIRGGSERLSKFQPRSFNMGISKKAFLASEGFGKIHPGEDPDLTIRLWNLGFQSELFPEAYVYHKRRIDWKKFFVQVNKFGKARPILNQRYPEYAKMTYWFPSLFIGGLVVSLLFLLVGFYSLFSLYLLYFFFVFVISLMKEKSFKVSVLSICAVFVQFYGYGIGFVKSNYILYILRRKPEEGMPEMFFK